MKIYALLVALLRAFLGTVLLFAGIAKLASYGAFVADMTTYRILPMSLMKTASYLLVSAEVSLGTALIVGYFSRGAGLLASLLFLTFGIALASVLWRELLVSDCGCANYLFDWLSISATPNWLLVLGDFVLAGASFFLACFPKHEYSVEFLCDKLLNPPGGEAHVASPVNR